MRHVDELTRRMKSDMIFLQDAGIWTHHLVPGDGKHRTTRLTGPKGWEANLTVTDEIPPNSEGVTPITGVLECYMCLDGIGGRTRRDGRDASLY